MDGKLEGQLGWISEVNYNFKIRIADCKKVIAVVDTTVHGKFYIAGSHFVPFDPSAIPAGQIIRWFKAPPKEEEEYASGSADLSFSLNDLKSMNINAAIAERGHEYYIEHRVRYLCLYGHRGLAVVEGNENYAVEFEYRNGEIRHLICDCPCGYTCKHGFAVMLQLQKLLDHIDEHYWEEYQRTGYFTAINKARCPPLPLAARMWATLCFDQMPLWGFMGHRHTPIRWTWGRKCDRIGKTPKEVRGCPLRSSETT